MCYALVPSPPAAPPRQLSFDVRGWSLVRPRREERGAQRRADALSYRGHFAGYTVAPKLLHYNPASIRRSHECGHRGDAAPPGG